MTTIAYKDGILAADTQMTVGSTRMLTSKIQRLNKNTVFAGCGHVYEEIIAARFFRKADWESIDEPPKMKHSFGCFLIKKGVVYFCINNLFPIKMEHPFFAIGSGSEFAFAFMHRGDSAEEAVLNTSEIDVNTNSIVETFNISEHLNLKAAK